MQHCTLLCTLHTLHVCLQAACHALEQQQGHALRSRTIVKDVANDLDTARAVSLFESKSAFARQRRCRIRQHAHCCCEKNAPSGACHGERGHLQFWADESEVC